MLWSFKVLFSCMLLTLTRAAPTVAAIMKTANISPLEWDLMDKGTSACTNFYEHACGGFINSVTMPVKSAGLTDVLSFDAILISTQGQVRRLLGEGTGTPESTLACVQGATARQGIVSTGEPGELYLECLNSSAAHAAKSSLAPLLGATERIRDSAALMSAAAEWQLVGVPVFFTWHVGRNQRTRTMAIKLSRGGMPFGDSKLGALTGATREQFLSLASRLLVHYGISFEVSFEVAIAALQLEAALGTYAHAQSEVVEVTVRDSLSVVAAEMARAAPSVEWHSFLLALIPASVVSPSIRTHICCCPGSWDARQCRPCTGQGCPPRFPRRTRRSDTCSPLCCPCA